MISNKRIPNVANIFYTETYTKDIFKKDMTKVNVKVSKVGQHNSFGILEVSADWPYRITSAKCVSIEAEVKYLKKSDLFIKVSENNAYLIDSVVKKFNIGQLRILVTDFYGFLHQFIDGFYEFNSLEISYELFQSLVEPWVKFEIYSGDHDDKYDQRAWCSSQFKILLWTRAK